LQLLLIHPKIPIVVFLEMSLFFCLKSVRLNKIIAIAINTQADVTPIKYDNQFIDYLHSNNVSTHTDLSNHRPTPTTDRHVKAGGHASMRLIGSQVCQALNAPLGLYDGGIAFRNSHAPGAGTYDCPGQKPGWSAF